MKDLLANIWEHLKGTSAQTRLVIGAGLAVILAVAGVMGYRATNPHFVPAYTGLDNTQFSAVTNALATAGIRFDASSPPGPFAVFVPEGDLYRARNAVATQSALSLGAKGIQVSDGSDGIFDSSVTREQRNRKRDWQDLELQLEALSFVQAAVVRASGPPPSPLLRSQPPTVSVVVHLRGVMPLDASQRRTLASIVRHGSNVPEKNITIADQDGRTLFDGASDRSLDDVLRFESEWADVWTIRAQEQLDVMFGVGMTTVSVTGEFDHGHQESVNQALDPNKHLVTDNQLDTTTPIGGPAGAQSSIQNPPAQPSPPAQATESEYDRSYTYGMTTTHTRKSSPTLVRMQVNLAVHESLQTRLTDAEGLVKRLVRFDDERDEYYGAALPLASVEVDQDGKPILPAPPEAPKEPSAILTLLFERGIEILAAGAFLVVLLRSLRKGTRTEEAAQPDAEAAGEAVAGLVPDEELDLDMLARKHVERMLEEDPEKVATLLSRWAMGDSFYAGVKS